MPDAPGPAGRRPGGAAIALFALLALVTAAVAAGAGRIEGRLTRTDGTPVSGATATIEGVAQSAISDADGRYGLARVPAGSHQLFVTLGDRVEIETVTVEGDETVTVETAVDWELGFGETITVQAASRGVERVVEAPAAVTVVSPEAIEREGAHGQLPLLLGSTASTELAQGGLYDFNLNTRGFGGSTSRRVLTLIDGRDPSQPVFSGAQEWAAVAFPLDEAETIEFVRGPGAALYGAGAFNGVLDVVTRPARGNAGGRVGVTAGEVSTRRVDARHGGPVGAATDYRLLGFAQESGDFTVSRADGVEYAPGVLPAEAVPPPSDEVELSSLGLRLDHQLAPGRRLTLDLGTSRLNGTTVVTGLGRLQRRRVDRPWARLQIGAPRWHVMANHTGRDADGEVSLASGSELYLESSRVAVEAQANRAVADGRGRIVGGISYMELETDSSDPRGVQTLFRETARSRHEAVFGQIELDLGDRLEGVLSMRWDSSDLHPDELSPRAALVYAPTSRHTVRLTWGQAFQSASLSERFLRTAVAPPLDLSALEASLEPLLGGAELGWESIPLLAVGDEGLGVEAVETAELGYQAILGRHAFLSVSYYRSTFEEFRTNLIPVVGTSLGTLGDFDRYLPAGLPPDVAALAADTLAAALPGLLVAQGPDGQPFVPLLGFGSFGEVDTEGLEVDFSASRGGWTFDASFSHLDATIRRQAPESPLSPNRADDQLSVGLTRSAERWNAALRYRWSDGFDYISGIFVGPVPSFGVMELYAGHALDERWFVSLNVVNLLDDTHWEVFGGDLLRRRALGTVRYTW